MRNYCHLCGSEYQKQQTQPWVCTSCGNRYFENPSPTVDLALFNEHGEILIAERGEEPSKGKFDLPGGFLEIGESAEEGLYREASEELKLDIDDFTKPVFVGSYPANYKFSKESRPILIFVFAAKMINNKELRPHDDVASIRFVDPYELSGINFSLPDYHPDIIKKAHAIIFP